MLKSAGAGIAVMLLAVTAAAAAERQKSKPAPAQTSAKRLAPEHDYRSVAGFNARVNDPRYAYAAEPQVVVKPKTPVVTSFPMPFTVWW